SAVKCLILADYGDIMRVEIDGASRETARADYGNNSTGTLCSVETQDLLGGRMVSGFMAQTDADRMEKYRSKINSVAKQHNIDPALIAAIISRESRAGAALTDGWGDWDTERGAYNAWGLMQVGVNPDGGAHDPEGDWDSEEHLSQATEILVDFIKIIQNKFPNWSREQQLKGGIAAYNRDGKVKSYEDVDLYTTHGDYSNDVVARAHWYKEKRDY
ncbi:lysozyme g-like, partial [Trematomus bernacchii]|uniref:lysozyme g-like n=1 Tax=Trematomus bernacchii TaxID=40690 RepID=UPI00146EBC2F